MAEVGEREATAWKTLAQSKALADEARRVGLDTLALLLDMVVLEAKLHVTIKMQ